MTETSSMIPLGTMAPEFRLLDTCSDKYLSLAELESDKATVIMFICNHCPYVKHIQQKIVDVAHKYQAKGVQFIAICSNDATTYPQDGPEFMRVEAQTYNYPFPYLYDDTQAVAKAYHAACTPEFYLFDKNLYCVYRGRFDGATPKNNLPITGAELCNALDHLLAGKQINADQKPSIGCGIKWKK